MLATDPNWPFATSQERWGELHDDRTVDYFVIEAINNERNVCANA